MFWFRKALPPIGSLVSFQREAPFNQDPFACDEYLGHKNGVVVYYTSDKKTVFCTDESALFQLDVDEIVFIRELTDEELLTLERPEANAIALKRLGWMK